MPPGSVASVREFGDLTVYIRRMFICERERDLLPPWARFVRGVIECPLLQPTASREGIHQDENFELVRQALEDQLGQGLRQLARDDPTTWKKVVRGHSDVIIGWAVSDNEFFERVEDIVTFRTTRGPLSLPEYLEPVAAAASTTSRANWARCRSSCWPRAATCRPSTPSWFSVTPFLEKYAQRHPEVSLVQLDGEAAAAAAAGAGRRRSPPLLELLPTGRASARAVASFKPREAPALMLYPQGAELAREAEASLQAGDLPGPLAGLVHEYVEAASSATATSCAARCTSTPPIRWSAGWPRSRRRRRRWAARADADAPDGPAVRRADAVGGGRGRGVRGVDAIAGEVGEAVSEVREVRRDE